MFARLGRDRERKPREEKPDPEKLHVSKRELNEQLVQGKALDDYKTESEWLAAAGVIEPRLGLHAALLCRLLTCCMCSQGCCRARLCRPPVAHDEAAPRLRGG
jgi:hypothetical protein